MTPPPPLSWQINNFTVESFHPVPSCMLRARFGDHRTGGGWTRVPCMMMKHIAQAHPSKFRTPLDLLAPPLSHPCYRKRTCRRRLGNAEKEKEIEAAAPRLMTMVIRPLVEHYHLLLPRRRPRIESSEFRVREKGRFSALRFLRFLPGPRCRRRREERKPKPPITGRLRSNIIFLRFFP